MKLRFFWYESKAFGDGVLRPGCAVVDGVDGMQNNIADYLMDDGGQGSNRTIAWIDEQIRSLDAAEGDAKGSWNSDLEAWGAQLELGQVEIYSLYDKNYASLISLPEFRRALRYWREFLQSVPVAGAVREMKI